MQYATITQNNITLKTNVIVQENKYLTLSIKSKNNTIVLITHISNTKPYSLQKNDNVIVTYPCNSSTEALVVKTLDSYTLVKLVESQYERAYKNEYISVLNNQSDIDEFFTVTKNNINNITFFYDKQSNITGTINSTVHDTLTNQDIILVDISPYEQTQFLLSDIIKETTNSKTETSSTTSTQKLQIIKNLITHQINNSNSIQDIKNNINQILQSLAK